jgi:glyoxylate reductase
VKHKIFITRPLPEAVTDLLSSHAEVRFNPEDAPMPMERLEEALRDADGLLVVSNRVSEETIRQASRLKVVSTPSVGYDNIDVAACTRRRIVVTNTTGVLEETTADLVFGVLLATARRLVEADRFARAGLWKYWQFNLLYGANVYQKTLGLIGFGNIGQATARRARGFQMRILYNTRRRAPEPVEKALEATYVDRETLLRESDFVSLHVPLTPETRHLIQAKDFDLMKPTAFLINTARGPVVDEEALVAALKAKKIAGAGLDVFEHEPRIHAELLTMENVVLIPHLGSATAETRFNMAMLAAKNLTEALAGRRPPNVINPEVYL